jgi:hypothetical protein
MIEISESELRKTVREEYLKIKINEAKRQLREESEPVANENKASDLVFQFLQHNGYARRDISVDEMHDSEDDALSWSAWNVSVTDVPGSKNPKDWYPIRVVVENGVAEIDAQYHMDDDGGEAAYFNQWNQGDNIGYDEPPDYDDYY